MSRWWVVKWNSFLFLKIGLFTIGFGSNNNFLFCRRIESGIVKIRLFLLDDVCSVKFDDFILFSTFILIRESKSLSWVVEMLRFLLDEDLCISFSNRSWSLLSIVVFSFGTLWSKLSLFWELKFKRFSIELDWLDKSLIYWLGLGGSDGSSSLLWKSIEGWFERTSKFCDWIEELTSDVGFVNLWEFECLDRYIKRSLLSLWAWAWHKIYLDRVIILNWQFARIAQWKWNLKMHCSFSHSSDAPNSWQTEHLYKRQHFEKKITLTNTQRTCWWWKIWRIWISHTRSMLLLMTLWMFSNWPDSLSKTCDDHTAQL